MHGITNKQVTIHSVTLESGVESGLLVVDCCLWGRADAPVVVLLGGISANRWALDGGPDAHPGWWRKLFNENTALSTQTNCFLTFEYFAFPERIANPPTISTKDQATILKLIQEQLKLPPFHAVIGGSYGGMVGMAFAAAFPDALDHLVCIAAADKNSVKSQALRHLQRSIMKLAEQTNNEAQLISMARSLAMIGYRGEAEWEHRFQSDQSGQALHEITSYLHHHGSRFAKNFSASRYQQLSLSIDLHHVDVSTIAAETLLIGIDSDQLVPVEFIKQMCCQIGSICQYQIINSLYGHDGFLLEAEQLNDIFNTFFRGQKHDDFKRNNCRASGY